MKLITANKLNRFWKNGILPELGKRIANSRVLKTPEEVEANTNEENIVSANVVGELINKLMFPSGTEFYLDEKDGKRGYNTDAARGADTFVPFSKYDVKASSTGIMPTSSTSSSISITVPLGIKHGLLMCVSTGWYSYLSQNVPSGSGINAILSTKRKQSVIGVCSNITAIYECEFNSGGTIKLPYANNSSSHQGYSTAQLILIA